MTHISVQKLTPNSDFNDMVQEHLVKPSHFSDLLQLSHKIHSLLNLNSQGDLHYDIRNWIKPLPALWNSTLLWGCSYRLYQKSGIFLTFIYSRWYFYTQANNNSALSSSFLRKEDLLPEGKAKQSSSTHTLAGVTMMTKGKIHTCETAWPLGYLVSMKRVFLLALSGQNCCITHKNVFITSFPAGFYS